MLSICGATIATWRPAHVYDGDGCRLGRASANASAIYARIELSEGELHLRMPRKYHSSKATRVTDIYFDRNESIRLKIREVKDTFSRSGAERQWTNSSTRTALNIQK